LFDIAFVCILICRARNDNHPRSIKNQFAAAQVRIVMERLFSFPDEIISFSKTNKLYIENKRYYLNGMELYPNARVEALFDDGHWYPGYVSGFQATRIQITFDDGDFHAYSNMIR
jgi:hypothetical protein